MVLENCNINTEFLTKTISGDNIFIRFPNFSYTKITQLLSFSTKLTLLIKYISYYF